MKTQTCFKAGSVRLVQTAWNRFTVRYDTQEKANLTYTQACKELGACLMHEAVCKGKIDTDSEVDGNVAIRVDTLRELSDKLEAVKLRGAA